MKSRCVASLSVILLLFAGACATTSTKTMVQRAPQISFKGLSTVSISVTTECTDVLRGPEKVPRKANQIDLPLISIGIGDGTQLAERRGSCADPAFVEQTQNSILGMLRERLTAQKYTVVPGSTAEAAFRVELKLARFRESSELRERKDQAGGLTCQKTCGTSVCKEFRFVGQLQLEAKLLGPSLTGVGPQQATLSEMFNAIRLHPTTIEQGGVVIQNWGSYSGVDSVLTCTEDGARSYMQNETHFRWDEGRRLMMTWLDKKLGPILITHDEEFKLSLFNVKGSLDNELGLKAAKENNFYEAIQAFQTALTKAPDSLSREDRARLLYNAAAAKMQLGELKAAQELISQSIATNPTTENQTLQKEIMQRVIDESKM